MQASSCDLRNIKYTWHGQIGLSPFGESIPFTGRANSSHILNTELVTVGMCSCVLLPARVSSGTSQGVLRNSEPSSRPSPPFPSSSTLPL